MPDHAVFDVMESPVGPLTLVASDEGLHVVSWTTECDGRGALDTLRCDPSHPVLRAAKTQLREYFAKQRDDFDLPLAPRGTTFQCQAWRVLRGIPYGQTIAYGEQARRLGDARKARAVGGANAKNPISIIVPCHRVIGSDGRLTGFGGGLPKKQWLLDHESGVRGAK